MGTPTEGASGAEVGDGPDIPLGGPAPPHLALKSETGKSFNLCTLNMLPNKLKLCLLGNGSSVPSNIIIN